MEEQKTVRMPVEKLSYSAMIQLLRNPLIFKLKYILGVYDGKMSMPGMIGRAGHEALKVYHGGNKDIATPANRDEARELAIETGLKYLDEFDDSYINYGKTGSREEMMRKYGQAMRFYFAEEPEYHEIVMTEEKMEATLRTVDGQELPLPAVGVPDIVHRRKDGGIEIIDYKFVSDFTPYEKEDAIKIIQSQFMWHLLKAAKGLNADRMLFRQIKVTENIKVCDKRETCDFTHNPEGKHYQIQDWAVPFNHEKYRIIFYNLYRDVVRLLANPDAIYLPNLSDLFDGEQTWLLYSQGLISGDMSDVEVMHKVRDVALTSKKFVNSRLDSDVNRHLLPEEKIKLRLAEFGIPVEPVETIKGASVTQYRFKVSAGIRMSTFAKHHADIARAIEAKGEVRILAPIAGTSLVGVEVPTTDRTSVTISKWQSDTMMLPIGVDASGIERWMPLQDAPHLLIAGTTGSGKSVLLHTILTALTKQMSPDNLNLLLIDPKRVELVAFAKAKHLHGGKIIFEYADAVRWLSGIIVEMERRYKLLEKHKKRDIGEFNAYCIKNKAARKQLPYIVPVIDEFADLILQGKSLERSKKKRDALQAIATKAKVEATARQFAKMGLEYVPPEPGEEMATVEEMIVRIAQMGRAAGIHLILATQRPSIDVITGLIKANFPTRIALTTASTTDSKVILGVEGAEKLSGKGDLLFMHPGTGIVRLQGFLTK